MKPKDNNTMKVIVLGAKGMVGSSLAYYLSSVGYTVVPYDRTKMDVLKDPIKYLNIEDADYVINAIGLINRWKHKKDLAEFYFVNCIFPRLLADYCNANSVRFIHISTDCVFDGSRGLYTELHESSANEIYGKSKALGEPANCMVLRTSVIGPELSNFYSLLSWILSQSYSCYGYQNHIWNGMTTIELSRVVDNIIRNNLFVNRIQHVFSDDITKHDLLCMIVKVYDRSIDVIPSSDEISCDRRLRSVYPEFIDNLEIASIRNQIEELRFLTNDKGRWLDPRLISEIIKKLRRK